MTAPLAWRMAPMVRVGGVVPSSIVIGPFGSNLKVSDYRSTGVPLIFVRDIRTADFTSPTRFVTVEKGTELHAHQAMPGDVLVTKMGDPPGDSCVYTGAVPAVITADCIRLRVSADFDARYVSLVLQAPQAREQMLAITSGVAQKKMSLSRFRTGVSIPAPPLDEQRRIVEILEDHLSRLDAAVPNLRAANRRLVALDDRTIRHQLSGAVARRAPSGPPADDCDDGELPDLPMGWLWQRLGQIAEVVGGVTKDAKKQADPALPEWPYLRVANVQRGHLDLSVVTRIRVPHAKAAALTLRPGDVLLNEGGDRNKLGRGWVWDGQIENCIHQNHVFRARVRDAVIEPKLLSWAANTFGGPWCERNGKQSVNLASISLSRIRLMPIPVPPRDDQEELVAQIGDTLAASARLRGQLADAQVRAAALRRSLLAAAFSGRLTRVRDVTEVVEELAGV